MKKINISQVDTLFANGSYPIEFLIFYNYKINTISIKKFLKELSSPFWPLFSNYVGDSIQWSKYIEDKFYFESIHDGDFTFTKGEMQIWEKYKMVNPDNMEGLFYLSVLQFNNGTVIIPKMNHLVGDGYSYFYFLSQLAALSKSSYLPFRDFSISESASPELKRTVLREYRFNKTKIKEPFDHQYCTIKVEQVSKSFIKQEISRIKKIYNVGVSSNDILSAIVVKKTLDSQKTKFVNQFTLSMPMDIRSQVKELGPKFFGNGLMIHHLTVSISELDKMDTAELALKIRESIPSIDTNRFLEYLRDLESEIDRTTIHSLNPYDPRTGCRVTNLSRIPIQKLNFGSGPPQLIIPLTIGKNSAAILSNKENYLLRLVY